MALKEIGIIFFNVTKKIYYQISLKSAFCIQNDLIII